MADYIWLIPFFPFLGFIINSSFGGRMSKSFVSWTACLAMFLSFLTAAAIFYEFLRRGYLNGTCTPGSPPAN
jgi:NADH-quinone oxidoreductase subunit L